MSMAGASHAAGLARARKKITVGRAPTHFGTLDYEIESDVAHGRIKATVQVPERQPRKPCCCVSATHRPRRFKSVTVNGQQSKQFDKDSETIRLERPSGKLIVEAAY